VLTAFQTRLDAQRKPDFRTIDLDGAWEFRKAGSPEWMPAEVPGCVHLDLLRNKKIPDPYFRDNEEKVQWVGETGWEYRKVIKLDQSVFAWRKIELSFKGLDTYANVYLNDSLILVADNMFREWFVDVKRFLRSGNNVLRIQFPSVVSEANARQSIYMHKLPGGERVFARKAAYHFGWDWGPKLITMGIWRPVQIRMYNYIKVLGVNFIQKSLTDSLASMSAVFTMTSQLDDTATIVILQDTTEVIRDRVALRKGVNVVRGNFFIGEPLRWWPNGLGMPNLYHLTYQVWFAGRLVGEGTQKFGLRTVELVQEPDSSGRSFYFKVNGIPVFAKGANYIPMDNFVPAVTDSMYRALIRDVKEAEMNMLRVWGGGIYENDIFYDLCDEYGIMVWQDFMFANAMYPDTKAFLDNVRNEAIQNIVRLRQHPSLVLWCGNNEIDEGWKNWGWQKEFGYTPRDSADIYKTCRIIFNDILYNSVRRFDTLRPYIPTSPMHGWGRPESMKEGDSHYWGVWWGKEPFSKYQEKTGRFMSEFGFQSFPDILTINQFTLPEDRHLNSPVMKVHQKHPVGYETIEEYLTKAYRKPKDFASYALVSQYLQAEGMKTAVEAHRRARPYCMGSLYWQLNDCWPVVSWSSRDYYGRKKTLQYFAKKMFNDVLVSPFIEDGRVKVQVISDRRNDELTTLRLRLMDFEGKIYFETYKYIDLKQGTSTLQFDTLQSSFLAGLDSVDVVFHTALLGRSGINSFNMLYFKPVKDLNLPKPQLQYSAILTELGYKIRIITDKLAKNVHVTVNARGNLNDNDFDILPKDGFDVYFEPAEPIRGDFKKLISITTLTDTY